MAARVAHRPDLKIAHEPSRHRLVKIRTVALKRQHGRIHTAAVSAFERAKALYPKMAVPDPKVPNEPIDGLSDMAFEGSPHDETQPQGSDSLSCGKCMSCLSFPCWYCIYCEGPSRTLNSLRGLVSNSTMFRRSIPVRCVRRRRRS